MPPYGECENCNKEAYVRHLWSEARRRFLYLCWSCQNTPTQKDK